MDFKNLLAQLDQLNEATKETGKGRIHTAEPGGYGRKDDEDDEGNKVKAVSTEKRGKGRPKKATQSSGEDKKYDFSAFGVKTGKDIKLPKYDKKKTTKHSLKDWIEQVDRGMIAEDGYTTAPMPGAVAVKDATGKVVATAKSPQAAEMFKKGDVTLGNPNEMNEEDIGKHNNANTGFEALVRKLTPKYGVEAAKRIAGAQLKKIKEADMPPNDSIMSPISEARAKADDKAEKAGKKVTKDLEYDMKHKGKDDNKAERAGKKVTKDIEYDEKKKTNEASMPMKKVNGKSVPAFAADGKGKNDLTKKKVKEDMDSESKTDKLPSMAHIKKMCKDGKSVAEICKMHPDCDQKELKQMVADCKKKMVKEGMEHRLKAAHHSGRAHALAREGYNCRYDDMEESRQYHEGYKQGLDECYGQMPTMGYVGENDRTTIGNMASYGAHTPTMEDELDEMDKTAYMKQQAIKTPGDTFKAFGQTFKDKEVMESPWSINEDVTLKAWDNKLNSLLAPSKPAIKEADAKATIKKLADSDMSAEHLLAIVRQSGLSAGMNDLDRKDGPTEIGTHGPDIPVDTHDSILNLIRTLTLQPDEIDTMNAEGEPKGKTDSKEYENSTDDGDGEEACDDCGHEDCECDSEEVNEDQTLDQAEEEVAEGQDVVNNNDEAEEEQTDATRDAALATAAGKNFANTDAPINEWANDAGKNAKDESFDADMEYMLNAISGGLNGKKSTGQSTIPVVSTQINRLGNPVQESTDLLIDWKKLSGIK